jgi:hypothetical protein
MPKRQKLQREIYGIYKSSKERKIQETILIK